MILRHHNEAESLHAVQKIDWEWKIVELKLYSGHSKIKEEHVPIVYVSDDFVIYPDTLPEIK